MNRITLATILFAMLTLGSLPAYGQSVPSPETMAAEAQQMIANMEDVKGQLQLTPGQDAQMKEILNGNVQKMSAVMQAHNIEPGAKLSLSQKMSLRSDLKPIKAASDKKLAAILTPDQMNEFENIRKETRDEMEKKN